MFTCNDCGSEAIPTGFFGKTYCKAECDLKPAFNIRGGLKTYPEDKIFWTWGIGMPGTRKKKVGSFVILLNKDDTPPRGVRLKNLQPVMLKGSYKLRAPKDNHASTLNGDTVTISPGADGVEMIWL